MRNFPGWRWRQGSGGRNECGLGTFDVQRRAASEGVGGWQGRWLCVALCHSMLPCAAVCCIVLHCVALCCSALKCVAVNVELSHLLYNAAQLQMARVDANADGCVLQCVEVCCLVLPCVTVCCSGMQCAAVCYSVLQYVAMCCMDCGFGRLDVQHNHKPRVDGTVFRDNALQHTATHCNTLQHTASYSEMSTWYSIYFQLRVFNSCV